MRKQIATLCAWLMLFAQIAPLNSATRNWDGGATADGKWSTADNWSGDVVPVAGDNVTFDGTNDDACTVDVSFNVNRVVVSSGYSGLIRVNSGLKDTVTAWIDDGSGSRIFRTLQKLGNNDTVHFNNCTFPFWTAILKFGGTGNILDVDVADVILSRIDVDANSNVTNSGAATAFAVGQADTCLKMGNNARFTSNKTINWQASASKTMFAFGSTDTFNGTGLNNVSYSTAVKCTIPALTYTGTGNWTISDAGTASVSNCRLTFTGNFNIGSTSELQMYAASGSGSVNDTIDFKAANLTCGALRWGSNGANCSSVYLFGSGTHTLAGAMDGVTYNTGTSADYFQTATFNISGLYLREGTNHTTTAGTSTVNMAGASGAQYIKLTTPASQHLYNLSHSTDGAVICSTKVICDGNVTWTDGDMKALSALSYGIDASFAGNSTADTISFSDSLIGTGTGGVYINNTVGTWLHSGLKLIYRGPVMTENLDRYTISAQSVVGPNTNLTCNDDSLHNSQGAAGRPPLVMLGNSHYIVNSGMGGHLQTQSGKMYDVTATDTISTKNTSTLGIFFGMIGNNIKCTIPGLPLYIANANGYIGFYDDAQNKTNDTLIVAGNINCPDSKFYFLVSGNTTGFVYDVNDYNIACKQLVLGCQYTGASMSVKMGNGTHTIARFKTDTTSLISGRCNINWEGCTVNDSGNFRLDTNMYSTPGTARVNFVGTARPHIWPAGDTMPICSLSNGAYIDTTGRFAELLMNRAGRDTITVQKQTKVTITTLDSLDWSGPDTSNRNRWHSSTDDTVRTSRCTLDIPGTRGFSYMRWRNVYSPDTIRCRTGCKSEGGNY